MSDNEEENLSPAEKERRRIEEREERRKKIVHEILSTEQTYVDALENMVEDYIAQLMAAAETEILPQITKEDIKGIFSNTEHLLPINRALIEQIRERVENWSPQQRIGDVFVKMAPFFKIYNTYQNNYEKSGEILTRCQQNEAFKELCEKISKNIVDKNKAKNKKTEAASLEGLLIQPVQRIPRYILLIGELHRKTPPEHADYESLENAQDELEKVMIKLDSEITAHEFREKFLSMGNKVKGANKLIKAHRFLIAEGSLNLKTKEQTTQNKSSFAKFKKEAKLSIWLFNDVMVTLKSTKSKKKTNVSSTEYTWPLELVWIKDIPEPDPLDAKMPYNFSVIGPRKTYTLRFAELMEKTEWLNKIQSTVQKVLNEENAPDEMHRYGLYEFPEKIHGSDTPQYEGWWKFGRIHGQGTFKIFSNTYTGEWEYNKKCGQGTFESVTLDVYHGQWKDDKPDGYGQLLYENRDRYDGFWMNGMRHGKGVLYYSTGDKFDGEWEINTPNGEGMYTTTTGWLYRGHWVGGRLHGYGILLAPNGRRYEGEFRNGMKWGEGKMDYGNGDFYIGQWVADKRHGFGILHSSVDGLYEGIFSNGMKEGHGKMLWVNGDVYEGGWKRNMYHDKGVLMCASGAIERYEGYFENGKFNGRGTLYFRNSSRYEGQFKDDKPHGNGIVISRNSVSYEGKWVDGRREGKATISAQVKKFSSNCQNGMMGKEESSFLVQPDTPAIHLEL